MKELLIIAIGSAIVNNVVLSQFLGICPFLGVSKKVETATGMGGAVVFVITLSSFFTGLIYKFILVPLGFEYLQTIVPALRASATRCGRNVQCRICTSWQAAASYPATSAYSASAKATWRISCTT